MLRTCCADVHKAGQHSTGSCWRADMHVHPHTRPLYTVLCPPLLTFLDLTLPMTRPTKAGTSSSHPSAASATHATSGCAATAPAALPAAGLGSLFSSCPCSSPAASAPAAAVACCCCAAALRALSKPLLPGSERRKAARASPAEVARGSRKPCCWACSTHRPSGTVSKWRWEHGPGQLQCWELAGACCGLFGWGWGACCVAGRSTAGAGAPMSCSIAASNASISLCSVSPRR